MCYITEKKEEERRREKVPHTQGPQKIKASHPDGFAGETWLDVWLSGCALVQLLIKRSQESKECKRKAAQENLSAERESCAACGGGGGRFVTNAAG